MNVKYLIEADKFCELAEYYPRDVRIVVKPYKIRKERLAEIK